MKSRELKVNLLRKTLEKSGFYEDIIFENKFVMKDMYSFAAVQAVLHQVQLRLLIRSLQNLLSRDLPIRFRLLKQDVSDFVLQVRS